MAKPDISARVVFKHYTATMKNEIEAIITRDGAVVVLNNDWSIPCTDAQSDKIGEAFTSLMKRIDEATRDLLHG